MRPSPHSSRMTGKQVELVFHPDNELPGKLVAAIASGQAPDFAFGNILEDYIGQWAFDDQLVDLSATSRTCSIRMRSPG
jgi:ABC-type glycerol-3-phosphate transport system substrate-binding protein